MIPEYYKKLTKAAKKKGKSELKVYQDVSKCVDDILVKESETDKHLIIRALIAYVEGKSSYSWFTAIMPIAYALIIGVACLLPDIGVEKDDLRRLALKMLVFALLVVMVAIFNLDFEKKMILCVLNDKLDELGTESKLDINVAGVMMHDKKTKDKKKQKEKKKNKKKSKKNN